MPTSAASTTWLARSAPDTADKELVDPNLLPLSPRSDSLFGGRWPAIDNTAVQSAKLFGMDHLHDKRGQTITPPQDAWGIQWPAGIEPDDEVVQEARKPKATAASTKPAGGRVDKRDKYREKNRVAAAKCRAKKKEHVDDLEDNHRTQSMLNSLLKQTAQQLRDELSFWRTQALQHGFCDCVAIQEYNLRKARALAADGDFGANDGPRDSMSDSSKPGSMMFQYPDDIDSASAS